MISKYARKKMLSYVARQFTEDQVQWLAEQAEFDQACASNEHANEIVDLGKKLLKGRKAVHQKAPPPPKPGQNFNAIQVPDIVCDAQCEGETVEAGVAARVG